jgi:drug/metabolite transporter (DMT)-like permease
MDWLKNGVLMAVLAHALIGVSLVWDKILLRRPQTTNLLNYVFWLGAISIFGLGIAPFGFHFPSLHIMLLGLFTGVLELIATYFYYAALKRGEASGAVAVMGGFSPVATVLFGTVFLRTALARHQVLGFVILVAAGFLMFFCEHLEMDLRVLIPRVIAASVLFGLDNVLQKVVFENSDFVSGFVFITLGTFFASMFLLVRGSWRQQVFDSSQQASPSSRFWYFMNRLISGVGSFLVFYAVSLASPAVVDALSGVRYAIVFVGAYALTKLRPSLLRENFRGWLVFGKAAATVMVAAGLVVLATGQPQSAAELRVLDVHQRAWLDHKHFEFKIPDSRSKYP